MSQKIGMNPWLRIWIQPRQTIRAIVTHKVNYRFFPLCMLLGIIQLLQIAQILSLGKHYSALAISIAILLFSLPVGYIHFTFHAFFLFVLGKLIKGKAKFKEVRAAISWPTVVNNSIALLIWIILMLNKGRALFSPIPNRSNQLVISGMDNIYFTILLLISGVWGIVILLHTLGEVQGFSAWMALLNLFLYFIAIGIILFVIFFIPSMFAMM